MEKKVILRIESGDESVLGSRWGQAVHISAGWNPFELVDRAVAAAAFLSGGAKPRAEKSLPPSLDVFGWCTWDAFYSKISGRGERCTISMLFSLVDLDDLWISCTKIGVHAIDPKSHVSRPLPHTYLGNEFNVISDYIQNTYNKKQQHSLLNIACLQGCTKA